MEQIEGIVEDIVFCNEQNGYTVCDIRVGRKLVTLVGCIPGLGMGETICVGGNWTMHQDYGKQFKVETFERLMPKTTDAIFKYLSSGIIKGIGEATAKKIVNRFGDETIRILQFDPLRLSEIKGISTDKARVMGQAFMEREQIRQAVMFFQGYGISANYAVKIWQKFGSEAIDEIKKNPYRLTDEDINIGFRIADRVALSMGVDASSRFRLQSGIRYVLSRAVQRGHVYLPEPTLISHTVGLLGSQKEAVSDALVKMTLEESITIEKSDEQKVYLIAFYKAEQYVSRKIDLLCRTRPEKEIIHLEKVLKEIERDQHLEYAQRQRDAIRCSADHSMMIVTGGPGTGKTTLIRGIISLFQKQDMKIVLAAPTGRAAKRMTEATGVEAKTIHRLLETGYQGEDFREFKKNENDPIEADVVIIDEVSMVDILLMHALLKAIEPGTRLVLVGDKDQLPSVGPGKVLSDLIQSGVLQVVYLDQIFRQAEESMIVLNAHRINRGLYPELNVADRDFFFVSRNSSQDAAKTILELCTARIPERFGLDPMKDIQVLSPTKRGAAGIFSLNGMLQKRLNPSHPERPEKAYRDIIFREKDRVMQVKNNYSLTWKMIQQDGHTAAGEGVFNGDMGIIHEIDSSNSFMTVHFDDGKVVNYDFDMLDELELSYAITVHKSQGSEFPAVVIALSNIPPVLTCRNLLYTGVTRAKQLVVLVGEQVVLKNMVDNISSNKRFTGLKGKLTERFESGTPE